MWLATSPGMAWQPLVSPVRTRPRAGQRGLAAVAARLAATQCCGLPRAGQRGLAALPGMAALRRNAAAWDAVPWGFRGVAGYIARRTRPRAGQRRLAALPRMAFPVCDERYGTREAIELGWQRRLAALPGMPFPVRDERYGTREAIELGWQRRLAALPGMAACSVAWDGNIATQRCGLGCRSWCMCQGSGAILPCLVCRSRHSPGLNKAGANTPF